MSRLISISSKRKLKEKHPSPFRRLFSMLLIDKFFIFGALCGCLGSVGLGVYLWLMRSGVFEISLQFIEWKEMHSKVQFYLFFVPFILGFLVQSASKLLEVETKITHWVRLSLPLVVLSAVSLFIAPEAIIFKILISMACWLTMLSIFRLMLGASWDARFRFGCFVIIGLFCLGVGPYMALGNPLNAVTLLWLGIVSIILGTAQQFIVGVIGGIRPNIKLTILYLFAFILCGFCLALIGQGHLFFSYAASILSLLTLLTSIYATKGWRAVFKLNESLPLAFVLAHLWALIGSMMLMSLPESADTVLHIWALGYATTLIIGISLRLISWVTETDPVNERALITVLLVWQMFVIARGFYLYFLFSPTVVILMSLCAAGVLTFWVVAIMQRIFFMFKSRLVSS